MLQQLYPESTTYNPPTYTLPSTHASSSSSSAGPSVILKHRFPKQYRHPTLDAQLTKTRLQFEARALARCTRSAVTVPKVLFIDENNGVLGLEKIEGWSVREVLGGGAEGEVEGEDMEEGVDIEMRPEVDEEEASEGMEQLRKVGVGKEGLMSAIGGALAKLHGTNIIHGDLTTSNMMVRLTPHASEPYEIVSRWCEG